MSTISQLHDKLARRLGGGYQAEREARVFIEDISIATLNGLEQIIATKFMKGGQKENRVMYNTALSDILDTLKKVRETLHD